MDRRPAGSGRRAPAPIARRGSRGSSRGAAVWSSRTSAPSAALRDAPRVQARLDRLGAAAAKLDGHRGRLVDPSASPGAGGMPSTGSAARPARYTPRANRRIEKVAAAAIGAIGHGGGGRVPDRAGRRPPSGPGRPVVPWIRAAVVVGDAGDGLGFVGTSVVRGERPITVVGGVPGGAAAPSSNAVHERPRCAARAASFTSPAHQSLDRFASQLAAPPSSSSSRVDRPAHGAGPPSAIHRRPARRLPPMVAPCQERPRARAHAEIASPR